MNDETLMLHIGQSHQKTKSSPTTPSIDISGLPKRVLFSRLYHAVDRALRNPFWSMPLSEKEFQQFEANGCKHTFFSDAEKLRIDLSKDMFNPTDYNKHSSEWYDHAEYIVKNLRAEVEAS